MKIYFPHYYKEFHCIASECKHSCCIGWEIGVDGGTMEKYNRLSTPLGDELRSVISDGVIEMCSDGRCPFLDECGLCRVISAMGEEYTSIICREHPRFYHRIGGRTEGGIGAVCEEACRLILSYDFYGEFITAERECEEPDEGIFDSSAEREKLFGLLRRSDIGYYEKIIEISAYFGLPDFLSEREEWNSILSELEFLDENSAKLLRVGRNKASEGMHVLLLRFLSYLIFRHVSIAESRENLTARVGFSILLTLIFENIIGVKNCSFVEAVEYARIISEEIEYSEDNTAALIFEVESRV